MNAVSLCLKIVIIFGLAGAFYRSCTPVRPPGREEVAKFMDQDYDGEDSEE